MKKSKVKLEEKSLFKFTKKKILKIMKNWKNITKKKSLKKKMQLYY